MSSAAPIIPWPARPDPARCLALCAAQALLALPCPGGGHQVGSRAAPERLGLVPPPQGRQWLRSLSVSAERKGKPAWDSPSPKGGGGGWVGLPCHDCSMEESTSRAPRWTISLRPLGCAGAPWRACGPAAPSLCPPGPLFSFSKRAGRYRISSMLGDGFLGGGGHGF